MRARVKGRIGTVSVLWLSELVVIDDEESLTGLRVVILRGKGRLSWR
jgi:hypothetical protein